MIPYVELPPIALGPWRIHAFGLLAAVAVGVGYWSLGQRLRHVGADPSRAPGVVFWILAGGVAGALVLSAIRSRIAAEASASWGIGGSALGAMAGALVAAGLHLHAAGFRGEAFLQYLDALAFALPRPWAVLRLGCALVHDHPGVRTTSWLGVQYPGGARFDLGLLELLATLACIGALQIIDRRRRPAGFYSGLLPLAYGVWRLVLGLLREPRTRYLGWTPDQYFGFVAIAGGLAVLAMTARRAARATGDVPLPSR